MTTTKAERLSVFEGLGVGECPIAQWFTTRPLTKGEQVLPDVQQVVMRIDEQ